MRRCPLSVSVSQLCGFDDVIGRGKNIKLRTCALQHKHPLQLNSFITSFVEQNKCRMQNESHHREFHPVGPTSAEAHLKILKLCPFAARREKWWMLALPASRMEKRGVLHLALLDIATTYYHKLRLLGVEDVLFVAGKPFASVAPKWARNIVPSLPVKTSWGGARAVLVGESPTRPDVFLKYVCFCRGFVELIFKAQFLLNCTTTLSTKVSEQE